MRPRFLPSHEIEASALHLLKQHYSKYPIPVPIEEIIEVKLKIRIIPTPGLRPDYGIDALALHDFSQINIDDWQFNYNENRTRFSLAHELGHFVLHKHYVDSLTFNSKEEWIEFILNDLHREPLETQANMFASYLLLPTDDLKIEVERVKSDLANLEEFKEIKMPDDFVLAPYLAKGISKKFAVSVETATYRLQNFFKNH